jgi:hypothetical protein
MKTDFIGGFIIGGLATWREKKIDWELRVERWERFFSFPGPKGWKKTVFRRRLGNQFSIEN